MVNVLAVFFLAVFCVLNIGHITEFWLRSQHYFANKKAAERAACLLRGQKALMLRSPRWTTG